MPVWLDMALKFVTGELPKLLKRHVFRTMLATAFSVILVQFAFLNPLFGSTKLKAQLISLMIADEGEVEDVLSYLAQNQIKGSDMLQRGAAKAGFYSPSNPELLGVWESEARKLDWNNVRAGRRSSALLAARDRAEAFAEPFQIVGKRARASSPDCRIDRPGFGKVFINQRRQLGRLLKPGDTVKIVNERGGGTPVVATIEFPDRNMPDDVDLYLNRYQMKEMLGRLEAVSAIRVSNVAEPVNQATDDDEPDQLPRCLRPDVR